MSRAGETEADAMRPEVPEGDLRFDLPRTAASPPASGTAPGVPAVPAGPASIAAEWPTPGNWASEPSAAEPPAQPPTALRVRLRFSKCGDLRWISHRDLVRTIERLFRRAGIGIRLTEGFHPKPRLVFPAALALGVEGLDEVVDADLMAEWDGDVLLAALNRHTVDGLSFHGVERLLPGRSHQALTHTFQLPLPSESAAAVAAAAERLMASDQYLVERLGGTTPHNIRPFVVHAAVLNDLLTFRVRVTNHAGARPRDVLEALGMADWPSRGLVLQRVGLEMQP